MAFILLMTNYRRKGYVSSPRSWKSLCTLCSRFRDFMQRVHRLNQDPLQGQVVVVKKHGLVIGTVCVECNPPRTPIDDIFPDELASLCNSNQSFVYLSSFAVGSSYRCTRLALRMLRHIWSSVKEKGFDVGICVVHPDHASFYKRFGFTEIAVSNISGLNQAPAALLVIKRHDVRL